MRVLPILLAGVLAACDNPAPKPAPKAGPSTDAPSGGSPEIEVPTTGIPQIQKSHDTVKKEIGRLEEQKAAGGKVNQAFVTGNLNILESLIAATKHAIGLEAKKAHLTNLGRMRQKLAGYHLRKTELFNEIKEIREMVDAARKGVDQLPPGYTETELLDRAGELEVQLQTLDKEQQTLKKNVGEQEDLVRNNDHPPLGDSTWTRELEALEETHARLVKLKE